MTRRVVEFVLAVAVAVWALLFAAVAHSGGIPARAEHYRATLIRCAHAEWGMGAPVATFAAQVHQESGWNPEARSAYASGLAQFTPATARWLPTVAPQTGAPAPLNPGWALRALVAYDHWLHDHISAPAPCDRWAMVLSAYNGGLGWLNRDRRLARASGLDPARWWGQVETVNAGRTTWAIRENRGYPRRILREWEPLYEAAGWGRGVCP